MKIVFKKSDFTQLIFRYAFYNQTSAMSYEDHDNMLPQELFWDGLVMTAPLYSCNVGHLLTLVLFDEAQGKLPNKIPSDGQVKGGKFSAVAKVLGVKLHEENPDICFLNLEFTQFDEKSWERILEQYKKRQKEISDLVASTKINE